VKNFAEFLDSELILTSKAEGGELRSFVLGFDYYMVINYEDVRTIAAAMVPASF
jgi:hypothetical protein